MRKKFTFKSTPQDKVGANVPYSVRNKTAVQAFWGGATAHIGIGELRAKRDRPKKAAHERKE